MSPEGVQVSASTMLYGVIGHPVRHSLSPRMQTAAFQAAGIDACYLAFEVREEDLAAALEGAFKLGFGGLNVTVPHKLGALALAESADPSAAATGAANTLVRTAAGWRAYNTDAAGFMEAVTAGLSYKPEGSAALVLGAGGAARAAAYALMERNAKVWIASRSLEGARRMAGELDPGGDRVAAVSLGEAPALLGEGDLLVGATPLGLDPHGRWPWPMKDFAPGVLVYDLAYCKGMTSLEKQAADAGFAAASGRSMLLHQGAEAFRLWTGVEPDLRVMAAALE